MTKREIIKSVLEHKKPPYVPWSFKFTKEPKEMLQEYYKTDDLDVVMIKMLERCREIFIAKPIFAKACK